MPIFASGCSGGVFNRDRLTEWRFEFHPVALGGGEFLYFDVLRAAFARLSRSRIASSE